eukprot:TRINITY_DN47499_c0_g1_i1.p1 TRINITY_DN47499_c0_g1~~TRINITY_DN47499_c0_g1_i1.p1  ORF type:complete len:313 (-),score=33.22 TRINITY_DN47499_c0_g1_i1:405-1343(-)
MACEFMSGIWSKCPSALLHLVLIECWPIPLSAYLFNKLINDSMAKVTMKMHGVDTGPIFSWYQDKLLWGSAAELSLTFNNGSAVHLPEYKGFSMLKGTDKVWLITQWSFFVVAFILEVCVIAAFVARGLLLRSFADGEYVHFAWRLPREHWYRTLVSVMMAVAIALPLIWLGQSFLYRADTVRFWSNIQAFLAEWYTGLGFLLSLVKLGSLRIVRCRLRDAPKYWHVRTASESIRGRMLRRPMPEGFLESSAVLGAKILDALWCAQHGDITKLESCLANKDEAKEVLEDCQGDQTREGGQRALELEQTRLNE